MDYSLNLRKMSVGAMKRIVHRKPCLPKTAYLIRETL